MPLKIFDTQDIKLLWGRLIPLNIMQDTCTHLGLLIWRALSVLKPLTTVLFHI